MNEFVNSRINRYELRERIGAGGMARVFKAWDTVLERPVALKILHDHLAEDPNFKERFIREARFIARLNHPNIVQVYDFDVTERDGYPLYYMVMSYIAGRSLRDLIENVKRSEQPLQVDQMLRIASNVADALDYAHQQGTVHRDVKPANVLITTTGDAVLTDFGIARMVEGARFTQEGISTGTPLYMSPEQISGQPGDSRSDLYSLGVMLYELISGQAPFEDSGSGSVLMKHLNTPLPPISTRITTNSPALDSVFERACAKNPDDRYPTAASLIADLYAAYSQTPPLKDTPGGIGQGTLILTPTPPLSQKALTPPSSTPIPSATQTVQQAATTSFAFLAGVIIAAIVIITAAIFILRDQLMPSSAPSSGFVDSMTGNANTPMLIPASTAYFTTTFDSGDATNTYWWQGEIGGLTQWITPDGFYELALNRPQTAESIMLTAERPYTNVGIELFGALDETSAPNSAYGIVFRYQDANHYHVFGIDGQGRFSIWIRENDNWRELREAGENWTRAEAINLLGDSNHIELNLFGNTVTAYVNDQRVIRYSDLAFPDGQIGIYFATDDGSALVRVDEFKIYSNIPSMTGQ